MVHRLWMPLLLLVAAHSVSRSQSEVRERLSGLNAWPSAFDQAYAAYPALPPGLLQAVSHTLTRMRNVQPDQEPPSCAGLPSYWGPMGLVEDGKGWFRNNLNEVSRWSDVDPEVLKREPAQQILAYAKALYQLSPPSLGMEEPLAWDFPLLMLSELPLSPESTASFALDSYLYGVFSALNDPELTAAWGVQTYSLDLEGYFGLNRYARLRQRVVLLEGASESAEEDAEESAEEDAEENSEDDSDDAAAALMGDGCSEFPGAFWQEADPSNYSSRAGAAISAITVHTMQGYYAGSISWFQNPAANVSAHYLLRASDGQITQMVCEADKAWHVGSENSYTVGLEHEGFVSDPSWYTPLVYSTSAALARDIADDRGINPVRTYAKPGTTGVLTLGSCTHIKGHQHFPAQTHTDPGIHWNWAYYFRLINEPVSPLLYTAASGTLYDPGGPSGNYADDQRVLYRIEPAGAGLVTLTFSAFNLETNWDYLYVHDGPTVFNPLLGSFTGTSLPGALTATSGTMTLDFRADCSTTAAGFAASWTSSGGVTCSTPSGTFTGPIGWTSATVNWSPVAGATQYQVAGRRLGLTGWRYLSTPLTAKWLGIFDEGTAYEWRVRAECSGSGWSAWSSINTFSTNTLRFGPALPETALSLAPNPAQDWLNLEWTAGEGWFELVDGTGRLIRREPATPQASWNLKDLPSGWYLMRAGTEGYWTQKPFFKGSS